MAEPSPPTVPPVQAAPEKNPSGFLEKRSWKEITALIGVLLAVGGGFLGFYTAGVASGQRGIRVVEEREKSLQADLNRATDQIKHLQEALRQAPKPPTEEPPVPPRAGSAYVQEGEALAAFDGALQLKLLSMTLAPEGGYWLMSGELAANGQKVPFADRKVGDRLTLGPFEVSIGTAYASTPPGASFTFTRHPLDGSPAVPP